MSKHHLWIFITHRNRDKIGELKRHTIPINMLQSNLAGDNSDNKTNLEQYL